MAKRLVILWGLMALLVFPAAAQAHKVSVFAYLENGAIKGEGYFSSGDKAQDSEVDILDAQGKVVAHGQTDKQGLFSIPLPAGAGAPLKVLLKAGMGHQGDYTLSAADLGQPDQAAPAARASEAPADSAAGEAPVAPSGAQATDTAPAPAEAKMAAAAPALDSAQLEAALAKVLDQKLKPLNLEMAKLANQRGVTLQDIVGGIGYIVGLMGLAAYLKSRKG